MKASLSLGTPSQAVLCVALITLGKLPLIVVISACAQPFLWTSGTAKRHLPTHPTLEPPRALRAIGNAKV